MWDMIWYLGFPMFAISVFGAPYKKYELDKDSQFNTDQFDVIYDQKQNGTSNYKLSIDGLSLVWSPNSLLAAAALLEPALYGEYPDTSVDIALGSEEKPSAQPEFQNKEIEKDVDKPKDKPVENPEILSPTVLVIDGNQLTGQKTSILENSVGSKRKLRLPGIIKPFLRTRSSITPSNKSTLTIS